MAASRCSLTGGRDRIFMNGVQSRLRRLNFEQSTKIRTECREFHALATKRARNSYPTLGTRYAPECFDSAQKVTSCFEHKKDATTMQYFFSFQRCTKNTLMKTRWNGNVTIFDPQIFSSFDACECRQGSDCRNHGCS